MCPAVQSAKKASVFISVYYREKLFYRINFGDRLIAVPLQVGSLPIHLPDASPFDVGGSGYRLLDLFVLVFPPRPNLKCLDALPTNSISEV